VKVGKILALAGDNYIRNLPERLRPVGIETLNKIQATAESFNDEHAAVGADDTLSAEGRAAGITKVAESAFAKLAVVEASITTLKDREAALTRTLLGKVTYQPPKDPGERMSQELLFREIRDQLPQLPMSERANIYRTTSDPQVIGAVDTAPMTLASRADGSKKLEPFIDPEQRTAAALVRAAAADPATANTLHEVRSLREMYNHAVNGVRREIEDEVNQPV
jgi:hypothetical protein